MLNSRLRNVEVFIGENPCILAQKSYNFLKALLVYTTVSPEWKPSLSFSCSLVCYSRCPTQLTDNLRKKSAKSVRHVSPSICFGCVTVTEMLALSGGGEERRVRSCGECRNSRRICPDGERTCRRGRYDRYRREYEYICECKRCRYDRGRKVCW